VSTPTQTLTSVPLATEIPEALRRLPQWVVWRKWPDPERNRLRKRPYSPHTHLPTGHSPAHRHEWTSYEQACRVLAQESRLGGSFDGLGFVFTAEDPFCALDLDHCIDDQGQIDPYAAYQVRRLASYTEITVSGQGLHIIIQGRLPGTGRHPSDGMIEIYDRERYFTMSGKRWPGTPSVIAPRQTEIDDLWWQLAPPAPQTTAHSPTSAAAGAPHFVTRPEKTDEQILTLLRRSALGPAFSALHDLGDLGRYAGNRSSADLGLANMIAFYTGDPTQVERIMRGSCLVRPKWNERRPGGTYLSETIARAANRATHYTGKPTHPATNLGPVARRP